MVPMKVIESTVIDNKLCYTMPYLRFKQNFLLSDFQDRQYYLNEDFIYPEPKYFIRNIWKPNNEMLSA